MPETPLVTEPASQTYNGGCARSGLDIATGSGLTRRPDCFVQEGFYPKFNVGESSMMGVMNMHGRAIAVVAAFTFVFCLSAQTQAKDLPATVQNGIGKNRGTCELDPNNYVANCGFETNAIEPEWLYEGDRTFIGISNRAHSGSYSGLFGPVGAVGCISQWIDTVPEALYDLSFWLTNDQSPNELQVWWNGTMIDDQINMATIPYTLFSYPGQVASDVLTQLKFCFRNDPAFMYIDDIVVSDAI
jgi:hypothetical protein